MKKALLVIDYTYDFVADDGKLTCGKPGQDIQSALVNQMQSAFDDNIPIYIFSDLHEENDESHPENKLFPPHNIRGTAGRDLYGAVGELTAKLKEKNPALITELNKTRYSCFVRTPLLSMLRTSEIDTVILTGVCTDICVLHTAVDAYNNGFQIIVPESCVASFNQMGHEWALGHFTGSLGADVLKS